MENKNIHTIVVSRHFAHKDNVGTKKGIEKVIENSEQTKKYLKEKKIDIADILDINIFATNQKRTQNTAKIIANTLTENNEKDLQVSEKNYLNLNPESGPIKKLIDTLDQYYTTDPDVLATGSSNNFVKKLQNNKFEGVSFEKLSLFYCTKLRNALSYIKKYPNESDLSIIGIHGGYFFESVIFGLFGDKFPQNRKGQINMGEQAILNLKEDGGSYKLVINYRNTEIEISEEEINNKIKELRNKI